MRLPLLNLHPDHVAEVIETATTEFLAQCLDSDSLDFPVAPPFGSLVKAVDEEAGIDVYAVVYFATTSPVDSVHRARAMGLSMQQLRTEQPQIFDMLKTEFKAAIVGFKEDRRIVQHLPSRPPFVHQAVHRCSTMESAFFSTRLDFLRTVLLVSGAPVDELLAATVRHCHAAHNHNRAWLVEAGREVSQLLKDDYDRLGAVLRRIRP
ncbi:hypothetical protein [Gloeobacter kilaueensis]|uniref:Uncharacterized protein n=1 Tax=Gloeobacter kilaueensis (strain ATCC BAA-2537 / CCAP 1431/1 / ULC 316 / JS1) TaxID=1183438 RepID=U5QG96_GLOK1|nr:hypothetical protein [Gloeobacter kilaueensis]AGY57883.1 hypothetical protein GKIL_1637 [Gloeobacter kilaueensis JS1]